MALKKIASKSPFNNISKWVWDRKKKVIPNPMDIEKNPLSSRYNKPKTKEIVELHLKGDSLQKLLNETHRPAGLINKIIDEVNKLIKKVKKNETDIDIINKKLQIIDSAIKGKTTKGHYHVVPAVGTTIPNPMVKKGGKLRQGGEARTTPVQTSREDFKAMLIKDILELQEK